MGLWDSIKQLAGNAVDTYGSIYGLPEMGLSEAIAGGKTTIGTGSKPLAALNTFGSDKAGLTPVGDIKATGGGRTLGAPVTTVDLRQPEATSAPAANNATINPAPGGAGGAGGGGTAGLGRSAATVAQEATAAQEGYAAEQTAKAEEQRRMIEDQTRADINAEYEPIFAELDRRLGTLPGQREADETFITGSAADQAKTIQQQKELSSNEANTNAAKTVRDLEENTNNLINAQLMRLGAGADGSAGLYGSEIITRAGTRERGKVLGGRDQILANIGNIANQEANKIETWKKTKLYEATQFYNSKIDEISGQKAQAGSDKARSITELKKGLAADYVNRLRQLDDQVASWKTGINQWQIERAAAIEDARNSIGSAGSTKLTFKTLPDGSVVGLDPYTGEVKAQTGGLAGLNMGRSGKDPYADEEEE